MEWWRMVLLAIWRCWVMLEAMRLREASLSWGEVVRVVVRVGRGDVEGEVEEEDMVDGGDLVDLVGWGVDERLIEMFD
ncbi:hypothetical protein BO94DRAFT_310924 [Aspergillus sclerotioniger CBS 115572]|uniref:Uncharacterized protein n=1 Tax=Aspergillus sclerotioniger CBS 115572 TaxID=1450535 RepID=A0A317X8E2_9EURO|nr:hypothetical protein BO94DRAFT_310924 [Aspergillus sclerotioniger CBS 115572]PWY93847.1 hypothetical protein BO94DRAFT_310924 [Aspergillus sclerotioniger CBS 115572]